MDELGKPGYFGTHLLSERHLAKIIRAISIRQPLVEQILRGTKKYEYRSRPTNIRERVYLYASAKPFDDDSLWKEVGAKPGELPTGVILGSVEITGCELDQDGESYAYTLAAPERLAQHLKPINQPQPVFWRPQFKESKQPTS